MGSDKALLDVGGQALATGVAGVLVAAGAERVEAQGGDIAALGALGLHGVGDRWPGSGPGVAVVDALTRCAGDVMVVAACDHPDLDVHSVQALVAALDIGDHPDGDDPGAAVVAASVAVTGDGVHPTLSAWRVRLCAPIAQHWMEAGGTRLGGLVEAIAVHHTVAAVAVDDAVAVDLDSPADVSRYDQDASHLGRLWPRQEPTVDIPQIDVAALAEHLAAGGRLFDVRQPDEYTEGHVPGAVLIPLAEVPDRVDDFAGDDTVYVICRSGARSARAVEYLRANEVDAVNVIGGTMAWMESGAGTVRGDQPG